MTNGVDSLEEQLEIVDTSICIKKNEQNLNQIIFQHLVSKC